MLSVEQLVEKLHHYQNDRLILEHTLHGDGRRNAAYWCFIVMYKSTPEDTKGRCIPHYSRLVL